MAVAFRQPVYPNDKGLDVYAYHRALRKMGHKKVSMTGRVAGKYFVNSVKYEQKKHKLKADGIIGQKTHAKIAPSIDRYGAWLIKHAKLRHHDIPNTSQALAKRLLQLHQQGRWHDDNGQGLWQIQRVAKGQALYSRCGGYVHLDKRTLQTLIWLIEIKGFRIGTYAWCSDHFCDGYHGHAGGLAFDISSINGVSVASYSSTARIYTYAVARALHYSTDHRPRQLICDGYGYTHYGPISALCIPYASFYGNTTLTEHRNHIHVGF